MLPPDEQAARWPTVATARIDVPFIYRGRQHHLLFRFTRPEVYAKLYPIAQERPDDRERFLVPLLLECVLSWDVRDERGNPLRLNRRALLRAPDDLFVAALGAIAVATMGGQS
jgi:hypothetical protein